MNEPDHTDEIDANQGPDQREPDEIDDRDRPVAVEPEEAAEDDDAEEAAEDDDAEQAARKAAKKARKQAEKAARKAAKQGEKGKKDKSKKDKKGKTKKDKKGKKGKKGKSKKDKSEKADDGEEPARKLGSKEYERELARLQVELVKLQAWVKDQGLKVVVLFEGRDAAGKGGVIKRITQHLNPRICRVVALPAPTEREQSQWYFQRYTPHLPAAGEMVLFDRSWYNRAGVERVMGFCSDAEYQEFLRSCPEFERMLVRSGIVLIKYWFSVSDEVQERRFQDRIRTRTKRWKLSPMDLESRSRWVEYSRAKDVMFAHTDIKQAPWYVVEADVKKKARLNCIAHLLTLIPYRDLTPEPLELPPRQKNKGYVRPPVSDQTFVPEVY